MRKKSQTSQEATTVHSINGLIKIQFKYLHFFSESLKIYTESPKNHDKANFSIMEKKKETRSFRKLF